MSQSYTQLIKISLLNLFKQGRNKFNGKDMMELFLELTGTLLIILSYHVGRIVNISFGTASGDSSTLLRLTITSFSG